MEQRTWYIYALLDPRTSFARYIGWSFNPEKRLKGHFHDACRGGTHKANWIKSLISIGLSPLLVVLETGTGDWAEAECFWIASFRSVGASLTNSTDGGDGVVGLIPSEKTRAKIGKAGKCRIVSKETRNKISVTLTGHPVSEKTIAKMMGNQNALNHKPTKETRAKLSVIARNRSAKTNAKISVALIGIKRSVETIAKMMGNQNAKGPKSKEAIVNMVLAQKARRFRERILKQSQQ